MSYAFINGNPDTESWDASDAAALAESKRRERMGILRAEDRCVYCGEIVPAYYYPYRCCCGECNEKFLAHSYCVPDDFCLPSHRRAQP